MTRSTSRLALAALVVVQLIGPLRLDAQGRLSGTVRDMSGAVMPGVSVTATGPALSAPRLAVTNGEGRYAFADLPDGTYTITFALPGFVDTPRSGVVLPAAAEKPLDVVMRVGSMAQTVMRGPRSTPLCTMRVLPVDPSIDGKMVKAPDATRDYTIRAVPPPCQASHPEPPR